MRLRQATKKGVRIKRELQAAQHWLSTSFRRIAVFFPAEEPTDTWHADYHFAKYICACLYSTQPLHKSHDIYKITCRMDTTRYKEGSVQDRSELLTEICIFLKCGFELRGRKVEIEKKEPGYFLISVILK